ncbi:MAG: hypothetical protein LBC68_09285 [Prevotellaceae bacterium]|jgi:hypothetical protein|nr:hypothetical protein [Prevotellaceae bacterium]
MKNIEKKISENINEIFGSKPEDGHRERFAAKLSSLQKPKRRTFKLYLKYVAAAAAVVVAFFALRTENIETEYDDMQIAEVKQYYKMQLNDEIDATKELLQNIDEQYRNEILGDIKLMEIDDNKIPNALDDERKAALIVSIYRRKIESLHSLQSNLLAYNK